MGVLTRTHLSRMALNPSFLSLQPLGTAKRSASSQPLGSHVFLGLLALHHRTAQDLANAFRAVVAQEVMTSNHYAAAAAAGT